MLQELFAISFLSTTQSVLVEPPDPTSVPAVYHDLAEVPSKDLVLPLTTLSLSLWHRLTPQVFWCFFEKKEVAPFMHRLLRLNKITIKNKYPLPCELV